MTKDLSFKRLAIVLPVYNEGKNICSLLEALERNVYMDITFVIVNDGSTDNSYNEVLNYQKKRETTKKRTVNLSRNFGHQQALMAGLSVVPDDCDLILVMDADFQDDPADVPKLLEKLNEGYDCVYGVRSANSGSFAINKMTKFYYKIQSKILSFDIPMEAGTFSVFNRKLLNVILSFPEHELYFPGIRAYVGLNQTGISLARSRRKYGKSKVGIKGLINLSITGILGFTALPVRLIFICGFALTALFFVLGALVLFMKLYGVTQIPGITTTLLVLLGGFGMQSMFIGIVGEYIGKLFLESKGRPNWIINEVRDD